MTKTVLDIDGKECFFNENDTICEGYTYIDIYQKLCKISSTDSTQKDLSLNYITSYSGFLADPGLGVLASSNFITTESNSGDYVNWIIYNKNKPININIIDPSHAQQRFLNILRVRQKRRHNAAGGDGTWDNPLTAATSYNITTRPNINSGLNYLNTVGNIYWIPYLKKYVIIEDQNSGSYSLDIWIDDVDSQNKIRTYNNLNGSDISINIKNKSWSYNINNIMWDTNMDRVNFIKKVRKQFNYDLSLDRYIFSFLTMQLTNTIANPNGNGPYKHGHINAYIATYKPINNTIPNKYPILNYGVNNWYPTNTADPIHRLPDTLITNYFKDSSFIIGDTNTTDYIYKLDSKYSHIAGEVGWGCNNMDPSCFTNPRGPCICTQTGNNYL